MTVEGGRWPKHAVEARSRTVPVGGLPTRSRAPGPGRSTGGELRAAAAVPVEHKTARVETLDMPPFMSQLEKNLKTHQLGAAQSLQSGPPGEVTAPDRPSSGRSPSSLEAILDPASQNGFFLFDQMTGALPRPALPAAVSCRPQRRHRRKSRTNTCSPAPAARAYRRK